MAVALFTSFSVAALLEERKELETSLQQSEARYRLLANLDGLTGLANRRCFDDRLQDEWQIALITHQPLSLLMIDVDLFKKFNDLFGHINGDNCLRQIAGVIADGVPESLGEASRFGGEEFAVILPDTDSAHAMAAAERLRAAVADMRMPHPGSPWHLQTISIGVAVAVPEPGQSPLSLLNASDSALYLAKLLGRNRVESNLSHPTLQLDSQEPELIPPGIA
jgi:diguanylate cyclase (GGDEF)-like protein